MEGSRKMTAEPKYISLFCAVGCSMMMVCLVWMQAGCQSNSGRSAVSEVNASLAILLLLFSLGRPSQT